MLPGPCNAYQKLGPRLVHSSLLLPLLMTDLYTLVDTPAFAIAHDREQQTLYVTWEGRHNPASSKENCALILRHVLQTQAAYILNDSRLVLDGWNEVTGWLGEEFFPALADEGVKSVAWVKAEDWPARLIIEQALRHTKRPLVDTFEDTYAAYQWLCARPSRLPPGGALATQ